MGISTIILVKDVVLLGWPHVDDKQSIPRNKFLDVLAI